MRILFLLILVVGFTFVEAQSIVLPPQFEDEVVLEDLKDPSTLAFSPDGRLFYSERISGKLRIAKYDTITQVWDTLAKPFYTFDVPASPHRSSGLRGITFDPQFESNGYVYAFYMKDNPRHNRVIRIEADPSYPDTAFAVETLILDVPFNNSISSGSHNGGDLAFGPDGKLYFTTGDGWNGGDNVQSLTTFTGKLIRINSDGTIPTDNPFYTQTTGDYRAIYALGLRNPYTMSCVPSSGNFYINDAVGSSKATVFRILSDSTTAGANFGHDGYNGVGALTTEWSNTAVGGSKLITGGAWYPEEGYWPSIYKGSYFAAMWGSNSVSPGHIVQVTSETNTSKSVFASGMLIPPRHKPVMTEIGPDYNLYYLMTDYLTGEGEVHRIKYTGQSIAAAPTFDPIPDQYDLPIKVGLSTTTTNDSIFYTLDGTEPDTTDIQFTDSIMVDASMVIKAIAYADTVLPSAVSTGNYIIGVIPNLAPIADAGPDLILRINEVATLNGSGSFDPDGSPLEIMESWTQIDGPNTVLLDDDETVANFTPSFTGRYTFRILVEDVEGLKDSDEVKITIVDQLPDYQDDLIARWSFEAGVDTLIEDTSPNRNRGILEGGNWSQDTGDDSAYSVFLDGSDQRIDIGNLDVSGDQITICFWTKINSFSTDDARFISKADGQFDQDHLWMVSTLSGERLRFRLNTTSGGTSTLISNPNVLPLNQWMHIAVTYDGADMKMFKDGSLVTSMPKSGDIATNPLMGAAIGNQPSSASGGDRPFDGWIDEMRIYGQALTTAQIDSVRFAPLEQCGAMVMNLNDDGNGSLRRAIDCAQSTDTIQFIAMQDSIIITSNPIDINNTMAVQGLDTYLPTIYNTLGQPCIDISADVIVHMDKLDLRSKFGPILFNAGSLIIDNVLMKIPKDAPLPYLQNTGDATIKGSFQVIEEGM